MSFKYKKDMQDMHSMKWTRCQNYKNIYKITNNNHDYNYGYRIIINKVIFIATGFETDRQAALALDKKLLESGNNPKNILKFKQKRKL